MLLGTLRHGLGIVVRFFGSGWRTTPVVCGYTAFEAQLVKPLSQSTCASSVGSALGSLSGTPHFGNLATRSDGAVEVSLLSMNQFEARPALSTSWAMSAFDGFLKNPLLVKVFPWTLMFCGS